VKVRCIENFLQKDFTTEFSDYLHFYRKRAFLGKTYKTQAENVAKLRVFLAKLRVLTKNSGYFDRNRCTKKKPDKNVFSFAFFIGR